MLLRLPMADSLPPTEWLKVYVGDEYAKDVVGARSAGWKVILLGDAAAAGHEDVLATGGGANLFATLHSDVGTNAVSVQDYDELSRGLGLHR